MLHHLSTDLKIAGVPDIELPPVLADYAGMLALALAQEAGLETIITRLEGMLDDYRNQRPPFGDMADLYTGRRWFGRNDDNGLHPVRRRIEQRRRIRVASASCFQAFPRNSHVCRKSTICS